jgi:hypothetical protein
MTKCGKVEVHFHSYLTSLLNGENWLASRNGRSTHAERAFDIYCIGGSVVSSSSVDAVTERKIFSTARLTRTPILQASYTSRYMD